MVQQALPQLIILLVTDQFRFDAFQPLITPNLYQLSLDPNATTFTNAYSSTPTCTPARAGLLTGKGPWAHGMLGYANTVNCQDYPTTLPSMLTELSGYETFTVGKNHFGWNSTGNYVDHGFDHLDVYDALTDQAHEDDYGKYYNNLHPGKDPLDVTCHHIGYNEWRACPYGSEHEEEHPTAWTTREALKLLQAFDFSGPEQRMFLKISYHRPHSPYDPPERLFEKYLQSKTLVPKRQINNTSWDAKFLNNTPMGASAWSGDPGDKAAHHTRAGYLANIDFADEGVGDILKFLRNKNTETGSDGNARNLLDSSMIIWATDHGDMNGDHNLWRKGYPYEASAHVNFLVKLPNDAPTLDNAGSRILEKEEQHRLQSLSGRQPRTSPAIAELRDIAVTIYDYLGILDSAKDRDPLINGLSLMPILRAGSTKQTMVREWLDLEHAIVYDEYIHWSAIIGFRETDLEANDHIGNGRTSSTSPSLLLWKYIFFALDGSEQLFCLSNDPNETIDLSNDKPKSHILHYWRSVMIKQFESEKRGKEWVFNGKLVVRKSIKFGPNFPCGTAIQQAA